MKTLERAAVGGQHGDMAELIQHLATYLHLARASEMRQRRFVRDRLLVLAAVVASLAHLPRIAARCRQRILAHNPQHRIGQTATVEQALQDEEFLSLLRTIQARYSIEKAERMLAELGLDCRNERKAYYSDEEYAAALLGLKVSDLESPQNPSRDDQS